MNGCFSNVLKIGQAVPLLLLLFVIFTFFIEETILLDKTNGHASAVASAGPAYPVHLVNLTLGEFLVDHCPNILEVQATQDTWVEEVVIVDLLLDFVFLSALVKSYQSINFPIVKLQKNRFTSGK